MAKNAVVKNKNKKKLEVDMSIYILLTYIEEECNPKGIKPTWAGLKKFKKGCWRN
ncbi:hypothetical protein JCM1393_21280 [Clostridium carnis]